MISKRLVCTLALSVATTLPLSANAQTGFSTLDQALSHVHSRKYQDRDHDFEHRRSAIVGMWITTYYIGPFEGPDTDKMDIAIQQFSSDGNELMNSAFFAPGSGNVCFGVTKDLGHNTFKLRHIGLGFNPATGAFQETSRILASFTVSEDGKTYSGTYTSDIINLKGEVVKEFFVEGDLKAVRFEVDGVDPVDALLTEKSLSLKSHSPGKPSRRNSC